MSGSHLSLMPELDPLKGAGCVYLYVDDADQLAGPHPLGLGTDEGEGVRFGEGTDETRALGAHRFGPPALLRPGQVYPHSVHPPELVLHVIVKVHPDAGTTFVLAAHHLH